MNATLVRSRDDVIISGVCGGLGAFMGISPTYVRLFFIFLIFGHGIGVLLYLLLWIMLPLNGKVQPTSLMNNVQVGSQEIMAQTRAVQDEIRSILYKPQSQLGILAGGTLIMLGILFMLANLNLAWLNWLDFDFIWPSLLIFGGLALLFCRSKGE
jgi:phage shock protein C